MRLADLREHGFGVVVTIQMLKRPDLLALVRRVREPAQVGEVVKGEPVTAFIPCGLDHRNDSQPLRMVSSSRCPSASAARAIASARAADSVRDAASACAADS